MMLDDLKRPSQQLVVFTSLYSENSKVSQRLVPDKVFSPLALDCDVFFLAGLVGEEGSLHCFNANLTTL